MTTTHTIAPPEIEVTPPLYPCRCGDPDCGLSVEEAERWFAGCDLVPHTSVLDYVADELRLAETCRFFDDHVELSIARFTEVAVAYPRRVAAKAIVEAVNTWHGCPEELCGRDS